MLNGLKDHPRKRALVRAFLGALSASAWCNEAATEEIRAIVERARAANVTIDQVIRALAERVPGRVAGAELERLDAGIFAMRRSDASSVSPFHRPVRIE